MVSGMCREYGRGEGKKANSDTNYVTVTIFMTPTLTTNVFMAVWHILG